MKKITFFFLIFIFHYSLFITNCFSQTGWVNQPLPINANSYDMKFFDTNTGVISLETPALLRTTNGGQNWVQIGNYYMVNFEQIDSNTLYTVGSRGSTALLYRTFNRGLTWDSVAISSSNAYKSISFLNKDTGWVSGWDGNWDVTWKTTDGGLTMQEVATFGWGKVFFLKYKINGEYYGWVSHYNSMYKTTNSGVNWFLVGPAGNLTQLNMIDTNTGWASNGSVNILKTTNGGLNWVNIPMPSGNLISYRAVDRFSIVSKNIVYATGGERVFPNIHVFGIIWVTTDGGQTWGFQQPDTSFRTGSYSAIYFLDSLRGWAGSNDNANIKIISTTNGGGPITKIKIENIAIPKQYELKQNYPNPFNPVTNIEFSIMKTSFVTLKVFDVTGREVYKIYNNGLLNSGTYKITLNLSKDNLSSGVYFYKIEVNDIRSNNIFFETKKMIYTK